MAIKKSELYSSLWSSCDELRGGMPHDVAEQTAIATIFSDMDAELAVLKSRLAKTRQIQAGHDAGAADRQDVIAINNVATCAC